LTGVAVIVAMAANGISDIKKAPIASGKMSDLTVYGTTNNDVGRSRLGATGTRDVDFYLEGICVHGNANADKCGATECTASLPKHDSADPCWIRYKDLKAVDTCEDVKLDALVETNNDATVKLSGTVVSKPKLEISNVKIDFEADKRNGVQCMLAGCDYTPVAGKGAGACTKYNPLITEPSVTAAVLSGLKHGFTFEPTEEVRYSIGVLRAEIGGANNDNAAQKKLAEHVFAIRDYAKNMQGIGISFGWMCFSIAFIMWFACIMVLVSPDYAAYKYTEGKTIESLWWLSTSVDIVHLIFAILIASFLGIAGRFFNANIEGNGNDDTIRHQLFWVMPNLLFWALLLVGLHGVIYLVRRMRNPSDEGQSNVFKGKLGETDIILMNRKSDPNFEQRASMVRNNLNV